MGYKKVSRELAEKVVLLYENENLSPLEVAERVGCHRETVYAALSQEGVKLNRRYYKRLEIEHISYADLDPIWAAEFRGFFYADGSAMLSQVKRKDYYLYRPKLMISLRKDNMPLVLDIRSHLGGSTDTMPGYTNDRGYSCNPTARWMTGSYANILAIIRDVFFCDQRLPATKRKDIQILYEAILARLDMPYVISHEDRAVLKGYYLRLKEVKRY